jgi:predicted O-methyltransferase YrrM
MEQYNTDKYAHGFIDVYEPYFNSMSDSKNILEIGVYYGGSLKYLSDKFKDGNIYGIDIENKTQYNEDRIKTYIVNQEDRDALNRFLDETNVEFDIIIDDGGHTMKQQQVSFGTLFKRLKKGGIYILEDLHTSRLEQLGTISPEDIITTLDMLYTIQYTKHVISNHILDDEKEYIKNNVEDIRVWTKTPEYNQSVTSIIKKKRYNE